MEAATSASPQARNELFQELKPCCVAISQLAIRESTSQAATHELQELANKLLGILEADSDALDDKLAEYVFFPLYHIFRQMGQYPMLLVETCIKCLNLIITYGWKSKISSKLVQQILALLVFVIDGAPGSDKKKGNVPEETVLESLRALDSLFKIAEQSATVATGLADTDVIPSLGHCITVVLACATDGASDSNQKQALLDIQTLNKALREQAALASFLPGTMSALTKLLAAPARQKTAVLSLSLDTVLLVLTRVLGDVRTRSIRQEKAPADVKSKENKDNGVLSPAWLKATTAQVKLALSTILKLRSFEASNVQSAVRRLALGLLDECHDTLGDCAYILTETAIVVDDGETSQSLMETSLEDLVRIYPEIGDVVKDILFNWMSSLPRILQASDESAKERALQSLTKGIKMLQRLAIDSMTLQDKLADCLKDSVVTLVQADKGRPQRHSTHLELLEHEESTSASGAKRGYEPVFIAHESERQVRKNLMSLIQLIGSDMRDTGITASLLDYARDSTSSSQASTFWLCYEMARASEASSLSEDVLLDMSAFAGSTSSSAEIFDELFTFSVQILDSHTDSGPADWRLEAIALEVTGQAAKGMGPSFRPELIDVLFPVANFLGSSNPVLREHAIITLNGLASACEYGSVSELIIDNVDYMLSSVSLRLNTLDISPSSIQVLSMMIRLAGPRLIPFLDDVIDSIFSALENYHGYPKFVELLFSVLKEVVDQASNSEGLLIEGRGTDAPIHLKQPARGQGLAGLSDLIAKRKKLDQNEEIIVDGAESASRHPQRPWKEDAGDGAEDSGNAPEEEAKAPPTPTYQLLIRIASLTQHYLTSPTPELRRSLLEVLSTASSALAADEDSFLPLVNAVWPVVISRLYDDEVYVAVEACHALAEMCTAAGDFLSSRFKTEWWDGLGAWCRKVRAHAGQKSAQAQTSYEATSGTDKDEGILIPVQGHDGLEAKRATEKRLRQSFGGLGRHSSSARLWEATVKLLTALVSHVRVEEVMFDEILDILSDTLERSAEVRGALERVNADAVWLWRYQRGSLEPIAKPAFGRVEFAEPVR